MDAILRIITNSTLLVTKFLRMGLADKNDHPPFFDQSLYVVEIDEDKAINHILLNLTAHDYDNVSRLCYDIVEGNDDFNFAVGNLTGEVYLARPLDYETKKEHNLKLVVSDGRFESSSNILVKVNDVNDNPPIFDRRLYTSEIAEEDDRGLPRHILTVRVTDHDSDRPQNVVFSLSGEGIDVENPKNSFFEIDPSTGQIFVKKPLDRDYPNGQPNWGLTVFAQDEGGTGLVSYSEVIVHLKDVNDNAPVFTQLAAYFLFGDSPLGPLSMRRLFSSSWAFHELKFLWVLTEEVMNNDYTIGADFTAFQVLFHGNVTENGTAGLKVITLQAEDYDDIYAGTNAHLTYSIEKNVINEVTGQPIFEMESETGVVRTAVCCLDREETQDYLIQVVAMDGGGLKGTGSVSIIILDINDKPPVFAKDEWITETEETDGFHLPSKPILTVSVFDEDKINNFTYKVLEYSGNGAEKFKMVTNIDGTGSLVINQPLDYEDPQQRGGFRFQIQVSDTGNENPADSYHIAKSWVRVILQDINDNEPQFLENKLEVNIFENASVGTTLTSVSAKDPDKGGMKEVSYKVDRHSDRQGHFSISKSGTVSIKKTLDREMNSLHEVKILALDDGVPQKTSTATLTVNVNDVNDNAPRFLAEYRPVLDENKSPRKVAEIFATDSDDPMLNHGPPYHFQLDPSAPINIQDSFRVDNIPKGLTEDGMAVVFSLREFDRETQKEYLVPIVIKDSGRPPMIGTSTLTVTIGDRNDNKMQSATKDILVYSYLVKTYKTRVGRVYVHDADDWDLGNKTFSWAESPHANFLLDEDSGMITMKYVPNETSYHMKFLVHDRQHHQTVKADVRLKVKYIPEIAMKNAGSVRLENITDGDFIRQWDDTQKNYFVSKADRFREKIAELFSVKRQNVDLFSVQLKQEMPPVTDIFFSVFDSQYIQSVKLNGILMRYKNEIEDDVGISILMVGINECLYVGHHCEASCTNNITVTEGQYLIDANRTSFVGVHVNVVPECTCGARNFLNEDSCHPNPCFHGGECVQSNYGYSCKCPMGYSGPRCQILIRTFLEGGFAWFPSLEVCESNHISIEFLTKHLDGIIFYNGPISPPNTNTSVITDFIALELVKGQLKLLVDYGSGTLQLKINSSVPLNDGSWHQADVYLDTEQVRIDLDHCKFAKSHKAGDGKENFLDLSECQAQGSVPPFDLYLSVNSPLQLGGMAFPPLPVQLSKWDYVPNGLHFRGCIRNLMINSQFYDLAEPAFYNNTILGCSILEKACAENYTMAGCGPNGVCTGSVFQPICSCKEGWTGDSCDVPTIPAYFENQSYVKYSLSFQPSSLNTDIQLRFRSWEENGELFRISHQQSGQYDMLEIKKNRLCFFYKLRSVTPAEHDVCLSSVNVSDGVWHLAIVMRHGSTVVLKLDGGEGRKYNESSSFVQFIPKDYDTQELYVGGMVQYSSTDVFSVQKDLKLSCMDDIRVNGKNLPLPPSFSATQWAQATSFHNLVSQCVSQDQCLNVNCVAPFVCKNLWKRHECGCPEGSTFSRDLRNCIDEDECLSSPCENGGTCHNKEPSFHCQCPQGFYGSKCELNEELNPFHFSLMALLVILVFLIVACVTIAAIMFHRRKRQRFSKRKSEHKKVGWSSEYEEEEGRAIKGEGEEGGGGLDVINEGHMTILDLTTMSVSPAALETNGGIFIPKLQDKMPNFGMSNVDVVIANMRSSYCSPQDGNYSSGENLGKYSLESDNKSGDYLRDDQLQTKF